MRVPFEKGVQHGFGVGVRNETVAERFQLGAQFQVVVDFAVEDDHGIAIVRKDGLVAAFEVNNFQARGAQASRCRIGRRLAGPGRDERGVAAARRMRSGSGDQFLWVKPAIPHKFQYPSACGFHQS